MIFFACNARYGVPGVPRRRRSKIVLLAIADFYSDRSPEPWPSVPTLAERCSLGPTAVLEAIAALERDGVLVVRRVQGRPNRYDLSRVTPLLAGMATPKVATLHDSGSEYAVARLVMETLQWAAAPLEHDARPCDSPWARNTS